MKTFFGLFFILCFVALSIDSRGQTISLPDFASVDSVRVQKRKINPIDSVRSVRLITINYTPDTTISRGIWQDSSTLSNRIFAEIWNQNMEDAAVSAAIFQRGFKQKGFTEFSKLYQRITNRQYWQTTWERFNA